MAEERDRGSGERRFLLIVNPSAGGGRVRRRLDAVEAALEAHGASYRVEHTTCLEDGALYARAAAEAGELPVVLSGDGLVGHVGGAMAGQGTPLGIIPGGRGNDLARVLGISTDPAEAVQTLISGRERRIDVGEVNGQRFLGIASAGYDSDANTIANEARLVRGSIVYLYAALRALWAWRPASFTVTVDGESRTFTGYSVAVANNSAYGGGMFVAPDAELDDGLLDVVCTMEGSKLHFLRSLPKVFQGTHVESEQVVVLRGREVDFSADRPFAVFADGDALTELPAEVRLLPRALGVIVPA